MNTKRNGNGEMFTVGNEDNFFAPIQNTKPFLKLALHGFAGSGKSYTGALIAVGLHKKIKSTRPIVVFDTEESAKFLIPLFKKHGIDAVSKRSRSLADLKETFRRCREGFSDILMIDSISHVWENFLEAYRKQKNRTRLEFQDWGVIKPAWKTEFSDPFVRDPYHCIMTGRAGYEYESEIDDETKKRTIYKSGVKMKVEGETAYEPDILLYMERFEHILTDDKEVYRQATVLKDRSTLIDGRVFKNPAFKDIAPSVEMLLREPTSNSVVHESDAAALIKTEEDKRDWIRRKDIALEVVEGILTEAFPGQTAAEKRHKVMAIEFAYTTKSWTEVRSMGPEQIELGHAKLREYIEKVRQEAEMAS
jgi:hypothetical protein